MANEADLKALYPLLHGAPQAPEKLEAALLHSIEEKARDSRDANARFFASEATNSFVVDPLIFPGGEIGRLAVCGTVNDLAVGGAVPLYLSLAAIVEEGVTIDLLRQIAASMAATAREAGVAIVTADTKVVAKGNSNADSHGAPWRLKVRHPAHAVFALHSDGSQSLISGRGGVAAPGNYLLSHRGQPV